MLMPIDTTPDVVSKGSKFAFSVGHVLNDLTASMWFSYLLLYYHRIVCFTNAAAGHLLLIGQIVDAVSTQFVGFESDRTKSGLFNYGRRKTWHLIGIFCIVVSFPFLFNLCVGCENSDMWAKFVYYTLFIVIFQFGWSCSQVTHLAMINELTHKEGERVALQSYRHAWGVASHIFVYSLASILLAHPSGSSHLDINVQDAHIFRTLTLVVVGVGGFFMIIFHVGLKEASHPVEDSELRLKLSKTDKGQLKRMTWIMFLKEIEFYQCACIWMGSRLILNATNVYVPLYIIGSIAKLNRAFVAIAPLVSYISSFLASFPMRAVNERFGRKITILFGLFFVIVSSVLFWFIVDIQKPVNVGVALVFACIFLGIGSATAIICSASLTGDLVGLNTECGAFVYGTMSFVDKLANGVIIALIQRFNPCQLTRTNACASYYRYILTFLPSGVAIFMLLVIITLWNRNIGANRHELIEDESVDKEKAHDIPGEEQSNEKTPLIP